MAELAGLVGNRAMAAAISRRAREGRPGVAEEDLVDAAAMGLRGPGQPLSPAARVGMESLLGADLSDVRVHADAEASHSAHRLSADAYTVGSHIAFAENKYDPGTIGGRTVLAHELVHVLQHRRGDVAGGGGVSDPAAPSEVQAERIGQEVAAGRHPDGIGMSDSAIVHRRLEKVDDPGWGTAPGMTNDSNFWWNPHWDLFISGVHAGGSWFPDGLEDITHLPPGAEGRAVITVDVGWFQDNVLMNYSGSGQLSYGWDFQVLPDGKLKLEAPAAVGAGNSTVGGGARLNSLPPPVGTTTGSGGRITVSAQIDGTESVTAGVTGGFTGGVNSGATTGGGTVGDSAGISGSGSVSRTTQLPHSPTRTVSVTLIAPAEVNETKVLATTVYFDPDTAKMVEESQAALFGWGRRGGEGGLSPEAITQVESGRAQIRLEGYASTTHTGDYNMQLSRQRGEAVRQFLTNILGNGATFQVFSFGEYAARTPDQVESREERRVDIRVTVQTHRPSARP